MAYRWKYVSENIAFKFNTWVIDFSSAGNVTEDDTVDGATGTYHEATAGEVELGVTFGALEALTGTYSPDFPDVGNVTEDDTVDGVAGTYHEATEAEVQLGRTFGDSHTLTGTYSAASTPSTPVITATDQEDGTGSTIAVTGSDATASNVLQTQIDGEDTWTDWAAVVGDGSVDVAVTEIGWYTGILTSTDGGVSVSTPIRFEVTDGSASTLNGPSSMIAEMDTPVTIERLVEGVEDKLGAAVSDWAADASTVYGWFQSISSNLEIFYERRNMTVTHSVFFGTDQSLTEGDRIVKADGTKLVVRGYKDASAGKGILYRADVDERLA